MSCGCLLVMISTYVAASTTFECISCSGLSHSMLVVSILDLAPHANASFRMHFP